MKYKVERLIEQIEKVRHDEAETFDSSYPWISDVVAILNGINSGSYPEGPADNHVLIAQLAYCESQISELQKRVSGMMNGFEGCCYACEPVGALNAKLASELKDLQREVSMKMGGKGGRNSSESPDAISYAESRGWKCFDDEKSSHQGWRQ